MRELSFGDLFRGVKEFDAGCYAAMIAELAIMSLPIVIVAGAWFVR